MTNSMGVGNISSRVGAELASEHAVREARNDGPERHVTREDNIANHHLIRLSGPLERDNIVNGYGLRAVLWTQGCPNHCPGCQNPETWDFNGGMLVDIDEVKQFILAERDLTMKFRGSKNQRLLRLEYGTGKILEIE